MHVSSVLPSFHAVVHEDTFGIIFTKLPVNLPHENLGQRFGISKTIVLMILKTMDTKTRGRNSYVVSWKNP